MTRFIKIAALFIIKCGYKIIRVTVKSGTYMINYSINKLDLFNIKCNNNIDIKIPPQTFDGCGGCSLLIAFKTYKTHKSVIMILLEKVVL